MIDADPDLPRSLGKGEPKNPRLSARRKYNRSRIRLAFALDHIERCAKDLLAAPGRRYKRDETAQLLAAVRALRDEHGLVIPETPADALEGLDDFLGLPRLGELSTEEQVQGGENRGERLQEAGDGIDEGGHDGAPRAVVPSS